MICIILNKYKINKIIEIWLDILFLLIILTNRPTYILPLFICNWPILQFFYLFTSYKQFYLFMSDIGLFIFLDILVIGLYSTQIGIWYHFWTK